MRKIGFTIPGRPQQRGSKVAFRSPTGRLVVTDANKKSSAWINMVRMAASDAMRGQEPFRGPCRLSVEFLFSRPKSHYGTGSNSDRLRNSAPRDHANQPDLSKLVRCLEDGMTGIVYDDDRQIHEYTSIVKNWTTGQECTIVTVTEERPDEEYGD